MQAQWDAIRLHGSSTFRYSRVYGITPTQQFGDALRQDAPATHQALIWSGNSGNWTSLSASLDESAAIYGVGGGQQVGGSSRAGGSCLWNGTASSLASLHLPSAWADYVLATDGQQQTGYYIPTAGGENRAVVWHGSAASAVSLHPAGAISSRANAVAGGLQGGYASYPYPQGGEVSKAVLWAGTPESVISLNPGAEYESSILAMVPGQQVGNAQLLGQNRHAALWTGTASSWLDLNPPSAAFSYLYGTCGSAQVGSANVPGLGNTAGIWFGTADSFLPLAPFLPPGYYQSRATCVAESNGVFYVGGSATSTVSGQDEAFMWVGVPSPASLTAFLLAAPFAARRRRV